MHFIIVIKIIKNLILSHHNIFPTHTQFNGGMPPLFPQELPLGAKQSFWWIGAIAFAGFLKD